MYKDINAFLRSTRKMDQRGILETRPAIICKDGYRVSVQAGLFYRSTPRNDTAYEYTTVELGYPNMEDDIISDYREGSDSVYNYVPVGIVNRLIKKHGGIVKIADKGRKEDFI